jgi:hypothetical protein
MGSLNAHFGMGTDNIADIRVYWPSGNIDNLTGQNVNGLITITENSTASIGDNTINNLAFYPNPVSDVLHLQLDNMGTYASYSIYDVNGKQVIKELLDSKEIKVADLNSGVYFIHLNRVDGILKATFIKE